MTRNKNQTAWAGALAVAAELSRRGYDAAITLGNTPVLDILCSSPTQKPFTVQVKSVSSKTWVLIRKAHLVDARRGLFFAVVLIQEDDATPFVFHMLTHREICKNYESQPKSRKDGQPYKPGMEGVAWNDVKDHRDRWDKLPA